jgi:cytochrome P450
VTTLGMELNKLKSKSSSSSSLNFEECCHNILEQNFLGMFITFVNAFVPLQWLPVSANRKFVRAKAALWSMVRELVQKRFVAVEARQARAVKGEVNDSRDLLTYMIEANLSSESLSREQIII